MLQTYKNHFLIQFSYLDAWQRFLQWIRFFKVDTLENSTPSEEMEYMYNRQLSDQF